MHCYLKKMLLVALMMVPTSVWAGFHVCNDTMQQQHVAVSHKFEGNWAVQGWWGVEPDACLAVIPDALTSRFVYLRLRDDDERFLHTSVKFCASDDDFTGQGSQRCHSQKLSPKDFARVDVGRGTTDFTVQLSDFLRAQSEDTAETLSIDAVFQSCTAMAGGGGQLCSFVAHDREIIAHLYDSTPREVVRRLTDMQLGDPVTLSGRVLHEFLNTFEVAVDAVELRPVDPAHALLVDLQGSWVSQRDPNDIFKVEGATRLNSYLGVATAQEFLSISEHCRDFTFDGFALHSWSKDDSQGLCYQIEKLDMDTLELRFLPGDRVLTYTRKPNG